MKTEISIATAIPSEPFFASAVEISADDTDDVCGGPDIFPRINQKITSISFLKISIFIKIIFKV